MQDKEFDLLVFIGKMRPFHNGHRHVIETGLKRARHVAVFVGSANRPRSHGGLIFSAEESAAMVRAVYPVGTESGDRISVDLLDDWLHDNDFHWTMDVQRKVQTEVERLRSIMCRDIRVGLIGYSKDSTSYYLRKFPQWGSIDAGPHRNGRHVLSATDLRRGLREASRANLFSHLTSDAWTATVPVEIANWLVEWTKVPANLQHLADAVEAEDFSTNYKADHKFVGDNIHYEATHSTTDAVLIQSGHVLLVRRKFNPGKGLWALPGGFLKASEPTREGVTRELKEETKVKLGLGVLSLAFRFKQVFSDVNRGDARGRIITHAYLYLLNDRSELPEVEAADDAEHAEWVPLGLLDPKTMYSDHFWIIQKMINLIPVD